MLWFLPEGTSCVQAVIYSVRLLFPSACCLQSLFSGLRFDFVGAAAIGRALCPQQLLAWEV